MDASEYVGNFLRAENLMELREDERYATIIGDATLNEDTPFGKAILEVEVKLSNGKMKMYGMNKTSCGSLIKAFGVETKSWIGKRIKFVVTQQVVNGQKRDVIFADALVDVQ